MASNMYMARLIAVRQLVRSKRWRGASRSSITLFSSTVESQETSKFAFNAREWWDPSGPFKALHSMNNVRVPLITSALQQADRDVAKPLAGYSILDVGCGAGILSEPLARLGATVTGIDPVEGSILAAQQHSAADPGINHSITYKRCSTEQLIADSPDTTFDCVVASEVIEHVTDKQTFLQEISQLVKPGGVACFTTITRTALSYLLAIVAAEQVLSLVPRGTHQWDKFITPRDLSSLLMMADLEPVIVKGMYYNPVTNTWTSGSNITTSAVNYFLQAKKLCTV